MSNASALHTALTTLILNRDAENGWERKKVDIPRKVILPKGTYFVGGNKVTDMGMSTKWVADTTFPVTSGELSREYLRGCIGAIGDEVKPGSMLAKGFVPKSRGSMQYLNNLRPPLYYLGQLEDPRGPWAYVDLTAAYFSIYSVAAVDMRYKRGEYLGLGHARFLRTEEWERDKRARNAVFGTISSRRLTLVRDGVAQQLQAKSELLAPDLVGYMLDTMHAIAYEAVERFGAAMWLIDAAAVRPEQAQPLVDWLRDEWGMRGRIVTSGPGFLWNIYDYQIGSRLTRRLKRLQVRRSGPRNKIRQLDRQEITKLKGWREWLLSK